jgi:hypothetical protein
MFNALVTTMTLIALGFVVAWWLRPDIRDCMEAPKYKFVRWGREVKNGSTRERQAADRIVTARGCG